MLKLPEEHIELAMADGVEPMDKKLPNEHIEIMERDEHEPNRKKQAKFPSR